MSHPLRIGRGLLVAFLLCGGVSLADTLEVDFNNDAVRAGYTMVREPKGLEAEFAWLHGSDDDTGSAGLHLLGLTGSREHTLQAGVGGKAVVIDADAENGAAAALGGYVGYRLRSPERLTLRAQLHYAPDALGFSGVESYFEAGIRAAYEVHDRASIYLGWRSVKVNFDDEPSSTVDVGLHVGVRLAF